VISYYTALDIKKESYYNIEKVIMLESSTSAKHLSRNIAWHPIILR